MGVAVIGALVPPKCSISGAKPVHTKQVDCLWLLDFSKYSPGMSDNMIVKEAVEGGVAYIPHMHNYTYCHTMTFYTL